MSLSDIFIWAGLAGVDVLLYLAHEALGIKLRYIGLLTACLFVIGLATSEWGKGQFRRFRRRRHFDFAYAYGLDLRGLSLARDETHPDGGVLQFGLVLRNAADGPLRFQVDQMEVILGDRTIAHPPFANSGGIIPRGGESTFFYPPFKKEAVQPRMKGVIRYTIRYGHPEIGFSRVAKKELNVSIRFDNQTGASYLISTESDEEID